LPNSFENCGSVTTVQLYKNRFLGEDPLGLLNLTKLSTLKIVDGRRDLR